MIFVEVCSEGLSQQLHFPGSAGASQGHCVPAASGCCVPMSQGAEAVPWQSISVGMERTLQLLLQKLAGRRSSALAAELLRTLAEASMG